MRSFFGIAIIIMISLIISFSLNADPASERLEEGVYFEKTLGDIDRAVEIYKELISDPQTSDEYKSEASYHLRLIAQKSISDHKKNEIKSSANQNQQGFSQNAIGYKIPTIWKTGRNEKWKNTRDFNIQSVLSQSSLNVAEIQGRKYWCYEFRSVYNFKGIYRRVFFEMDSLRPVISFYRTNTSETTIYYGNNSIEIKRDRQGSINFRKISTNGIVYDDVHIVILVESLPLKVGYETTFLMFAPRLKKPVETKITVLKKEMVRVPLGTFECYLVHFNFDSSGLWEHGFSGWYSTSTGRLIKAQSANPPTAIMSELSEISINPADIADFSSGAI